MILNFDDKLALLAGDSLVAAGDSVLDDQIAAETTLFSLNCSSQQHTEQLCSAQ